jgi:hypothetical protein
MIGFQQMELLAQRSGTALTVGLMGMPNIFRNETIVYGNHET